MMGSTTQAMVSFTWLLNQSTSAEPEAVPVADIDGVSQSSKYSQVVRDARAVVGLVRVLQQRPMTAPKTAAEPCRVTRVGRRTLATRRRAGPRRGAPGQA